MLSKNQVVAARKAIESTYIGQCTITEHQKMKKENGSIAFEEVVVLSEKPCKLSFEKIANNNQTNSAAILIQTTKLFIAPEIQIKPGSKITVVQNNVTTEYKSSGEPAMYQTHQEIMLELFKGWS